MKKILLKVFGCKVNQYEVQVMQERFLRDGFELVAQNREADYLVVNTCTVTEASDKELEYTVRKAKKDNPEIKVLLAGCYVSHHLEKIQNNPWIDGTIQDSNKYRIPELIRKYEEDLKRNFSNDLPEAFKNEYYGIHYFSGRSRAFVKVQDGCNKKCTFCIVTVVRGNSRSRSQEEILEEMRRLAESGYREVVLTGVQIGAYGRDLQQKNALPSLIRSIADEIPSIVRIRLSSIDPLYVTKELLDCMKETPKFCNHLHISMQSGDDQILKSMLRGHTAAKFERLVTMFYEQVPGFCLSTDMIVGFPGEDATAFENSCRLLEKLEPIKTHVFPYSDREGTAAFHFGEKVPEKEKKRRVHEMLQVAENCFRKKAATFVGQAGEVLIEREGMHDESSFSQGRLSNYLLVRFPATGFLRNSLTSVQLEGVGDQYLEGRSLKREMVQIT